MEKIDRIKRASEGRIEKRCDQSYSVFFSGELHFIERLEEETLRVGVDHGATNLQDVRILDVRCGRRARLGDWIQWGQVTVFAIWRGLSQRVGLESVAIDARLSRCRGVGNSVVLPGQ